MDFNVEMMQEITEPQGELQFFYPESQEDEKLKKFVSYLMKKDRYVSDELRNYDTLWQMVFSIFYGGKINLVFQIGDFQGMIGFLDIIPGWKCRLMFKIWDKAIWNKQNIRDGRKLVDRMFDKFDLIRMEVHSADPVMFKMSKMFGFKEEGRMLKAFKWDGKIYDLALFSRIMEE
jgi:RimJ/RimL family protein N-acetyltransferase